MKRYRQITEWVKRAASFGLSAVLACMAVLPYPCSWLFILSPTPAHAGISVRICKKGIRRALSKARLRLYQVKTSYPSCVTATVISHWAEGLPSAV